MRERAKHSADIEELRRARQLKEMRERAKHSADIEELRRARQLKEMRERAKHSADIEELRRARQLNEMREKERCRHTISNEKSKSRRRAKFSANEGEQVSVRSRGADRVLNKYHTACLPM